MLPLEIFAGILDHLVEDGPPKDIHTLRACSQVSFPLRRLAQRHIFSEISLALDLRLRNRALVEDISISLPYKFLRLITDRRSAHIAALVKHVWIGLDHWNDDPHSHTYDEDSEIVATWWSSAAWTECLSIQYILPRLTNLQSLRLGIDSRSLPFPSLDAGSQKAIIDLCKNQLIRLDIARGCCFPSHALYNCRYLKHLTIRESLRPSPETPWNLHSCPTVLDTLTTVDSGWYDSPRPRDGPFLTVIGCPIDVTRLRRLVIEDYATLDFRTALASCSSTLEELRLNASFFAFASYGMLGSPMNTGAESNWEFKPPNLGNFQRLRRLEFVARLEVQFVAPDSNETVYSSTLPWVGAVMESLSEEGPLGVVEVDVVSKSRTFGGSKLLLVDFAPLSRAFGAGLDDHDDQMGLSSHWKELKTPELMLRLRHAIGDSAVNRPNLAEHPDLQELAKRGKLTTIYQNL